MNTALNTQYISFQKPSVPVIVDKIDFHQKEELPVGKRIGLLAWTQSNNTDVTQKLSVTKETCVKTEDTYEFRWEKETRISGERFVIMVIL